MENVGGNAGPRVLKERCGSIRWKGMFIEVQRDAIESQPHERIFWCVQTQNCLGPDGQVVDQDACNATRSCYQRL